mmetsp:Transcript_64095/g.152865  ORF Transcript_64095/g.152865 Transcript_64095/m.152865 type:complete len:282 (+) Transcript_64095:63-908(+)
MPSLPPYYKRLAAKSEKPKLDPQWYGGQLERRKSAPRKSWSSNFTKFDKIHDQAKQLHEKTTKECAELLETKKHANHASVDSETRMSLMEASRRSSSSRPSLVLKDSQGSRGSRVGLQTAPAPGSGGDAEVVALPMEGRKTSVKTDASSVQDSRDLVFSSTGTAEAPVEARRKKVPGQPTLLQNVYEPAKTVDKFGRVGLRGVRSVSDVTRYSKEVVPYSRKEADIRTAFKNYRLKQSRALHMSACTWDALHDWKASEMHFRTWVPSAEKGEKHFYEWNQP